MTKSNITFYRGEDFFCRLVFHDRKGNEVAIPSYDFVLEYYTDTAKKYVVSKKKGVLSDTCVKNGADGYLYARFEKPDFRRGILMRKATYTVPAPLMEDGYRTVIIIEEIGKVV